MNTNYEAPCYFTSSFINTIYPTFFRKLRSPLSAQREIVVLRDDDILSYDWYAKKSRKIAIISHGLGGHSGRVYVKGMTNKLLESGWDVAAWNYRSCGDCMNLTTRLYHGGITDDLEDVIAHIQEKDLYDEVALVGFSIGGNINLLYLGQRPEQVSPLIKKSVAISVPCDLKACALELGKIKNRLFLRHFLKTFRQLIAEKEKTFPEQFREKDFETIRNFRDYDNQYTAPLHGFTDAEDYWKSCSCKMHIPAIRQKTLVVTALDDPFLAEPCYPNKEASSNENVTLITPKYGGHVGFCGTGDSYWSENITSDFLN